MGPVGDFLDPLDYSLQTWTNWPEEWSIFSGAKKKNSAQFVLQSSPGALAANHETKSTILII